MFLINLLANNSSWFRGTLTSIVKICPIIISDEVLQGPKASVYFCDFDPSKQGHDIPKEQVEQMMLAEPYQRKIDTCHLYVSACVMFLLLDCLRHPQPFCILGLALSNSCSNCKNNFLPHQFCFLTISLSVFLNCIFIVTESFLFLQNNLKQGNSEICEIRCNI